MKYADNSNSYVKPKSAAQTISRLNAVDKPDCTVKAFASSANNGLPETPHWRDDSWENRSRSNGSETELVHLPL